MKNIIQQPNLDTLATLYNDRFQLYGPDIKTVGWGSEDSQTLRFDVLFRGINPKGKTILDVGCGLGALVPFLEQMTNNDFNYVGIDIAEALIESANSNYCKIGRSFYVGDIFNVNLPDIDIAILSGTLSARMDGMESYAIATMERMYQSAKIGACLNFLSTYADFELQKNLHYQPENIFSAAKKISKKVNLYHDYELHEFTLQIFK